MKVIENGMVRRSNNSARSNCAHRERKTDFGRGVNVVNRWERDCDRSDKRRGNTIVDRYERRSRGQGGLISVLIDFCQEGSAENRQYLPSRSASNRSNRSRIHRPVQHSPARSMTTNQGGIGKSCRRDLRQRFHPVANLTRRNAMCRAA